MSKGYEYRISGCIECPFLLEDSEYGSFCNHPSKAYRGMDYDDRDKIKIHDAEVKIGRISKWSGNECSEMYYPITPDWCPLKKESAMITLLQRDENGNYNIFEKPEQCHFNTDNK